MFIPFLYPAHHDRPMTSRKLRRPPPKPIGGSAMMRRARAHAICLVAAMPLGGTALAGDLTPPLVTKPSAPPAHFDWNGAYLGVHTGYGGGHSDTALSGPAFARGHNTFGGILGGVQAGYNIVLPSRLLLGLEADITFPSYLDSNSVVSSLTTPQGTLTEQIDYTGTLRGRLGYAAPRWMVYATAGLAFAGERFLETSPAGLNEKKLYLRHGWAAGAGLEFAIAPQWSARLEYLYSDFGSADVVLGSSTRSTTSMDLQSLRVGLNRKLDWPDLPGAGLAPKSAGALPRNWEIWGESVYIGQGYPGFRAPYSGTNSLAPSAQAKATWGSGLNINARLWDGGEIYFNPELLQGFGLSNTVGLAGFSNGEAQKSDFSYPRFNPSRLYIRHTFGFGGEQETLQSAPNQLGGKVDVSRLTVQVGKFAVTDVFDDNAYAKDPRKDFMNWALWAPGAFDYSADKLGLAYGATAELNQKSWALRAGYFLMDAEPNSDNFDMKVFQRGNYVVELERRYALFGRPGKFRAIAWLNSAYSGSYRETLNQPALNLNIARTREGRIKYGYVLNFEQAVTDDVGLFGRWSWNDGKTEIMAFTDIDSSLSFGTSIKGASWGRPDDTIGIGGAINALSRDHRDFIAAGGLGILIGDGHLNYRQENILEVYYAMALTKAITLTADYQFIRHPAYNADRGPVSIFSGRLRGEF